jgi:hypothetical protein
MRWIEIIQLRAPRESTLNTLIDELSRTLKDEHVEVTLYRHAAVSTDLSIHLGYETAGDAAPDCTLGQRLAASLDDHGVVNRSLWREARGSHDTTRRRS